MAIPSSHRLTQHDESTEDSLCHQFSLLPSPSKSTSHHPTATHAPPSHSRNTQVSKSLFSLPTASSTPVKSEKPKESYLLGSEISLSEVYSSPSKLCPYTHFSAIIQIPRFKSVILILDNREVRTKNDRDYMCTKLTSMGISTLFPSIIKICLCWFDLICKYTNRSEGIVYWGCHVDCSGWQFEWMGAGLHCWEEESGRFVVYISPCLSLPFPLHGSTHSFYSTVPQ